MIELFLSTDGKNTVHISSETKEEMDKLVIYAKSLYKDIVSELGTKAQMWAEFNGKDSHKFMPQGTNRTDVPRCPVHNQLLKKRNGQFGSFWSCGTRLDDGTWCSYKPPKEKLADKVSIGKGGNST